MKLINILTIKNRKCFSQLRGFTLNFALSIWGEIIWLISNKEHVAGKQRCSGDQYSSASTAARFEYKLLSLI